MEKFNMSAKIIMTCSGIDKLSEEDKFEIALQVEQELNGIGLFRTMLTDNTSTGKEVKVGIRVHMKGE